MKHHPTLVGLLLWALLTGCSAEPADSESGEPESDSGEMPYRPGRDAGTPDAGASIDGGFADAGHGMDGGAADAGSAIDAGRPDAGHDADGGAADAGPGSDGGPGPREDGGSSTDGGPAQDGGPGPSEDGGSGTDGGPAQDGGPREDGGSGTDGGPAQDGGPAPTVPSVLGSSPDGESTHVDVRPDIQVTFSEAMNVGSLTSESFILERGGRNVPGQVAAVSNVATFRPEGRLTLLGQYRARISATVRSAKNVPLGRDHVWSFRVRDGSWGEARQLGTHVPAASGSSPQVAFDGQGRALAIWAGSEGSRQGIWVRPHSPAGDWGATQVISPTNQGEASNPRLVMGPDGTAVAVWFQHKPSASFQLWSSQYRPALGWTEAQLVDPGNFGDATTLQLAMDSQGRTLAAWTQFDFDTFTENVWTARLEQPWSGGWSRAERVDVDDWNYTFDLRLAMNAEGQAIAVWYRFDQENFRGSVWSRRFSPAGGWGALERLEDDDAADALLPTADVGGDGSIWALWLQPDERGINTVVSRQYVPGEGWGSPRAIDVVEGGHSIEPEVLVSEGGQVLAVWSRYDGTRNDLIANHFEPDHGWAEASQLEDDDTAEARRPRLARDPAGNALVVWEQGDGSRVLTRAARFVWGQGWGRAMTLGSGDSTGNASQPQVAIGPDGRGFACWAESLGNGTQMVVVPFE